MTKDTIAETAALKALLSETSDHQILAEMLGFVADRLMALDVDHLCGAGAHERSPGRVNHRNGYPLAGRAYHAREAPPPMGNSRRGRRCADPETSQGDVFSRVSGAPPRLGEGYDRGDPGGLHSGRVHPISG